MAHTAHTASRTTRTLNSSGTFLLTLTALAALTILTVLPATFSLPGSALAGKLDDIKRSAGQSTSKGASARDAEAWYQTGEDYFQGRNGRPEDEAQAVFWYRKAAEAGHAQAQYDLGWMYRNGRGVSQDDKQAVFWFRKAAEAGNAPAQAQLGYMYGNGYGTPEDSRQAVFWYRKAAEAGNDGGMNGLGYMYEMGRGGLPEDHEQAVVWYRKAAEAGSAIAQGNLAYMYERGRGVRQDDEQAVFWYRKAAEKGSARGQYELGKMYEAGRGGLSKDRDQAISWYRKAADQGHDDAQAALRRLTADQSASSSQSAQSARSARPKKLPTYKNSLGMEFLLIPAGTFQMGCAPQEEECDSEARPRHEVRISRPFYLSRYEVTQKQWEAIMGTNPSRFKGPDHPVGNVSWNDVQAFIRKLNAKEGHKRYRLPTEAEWEYAARAGATTAYSFGDDKAQLGDHAWYDENSGGETHPVGQKQPNAWGLYDVHGNVWEWVADWKGEYGAEPVTDPRGPSSGTYHPARGGGFERDAIDCKITYRNIGRPDDTYVFYGFRLAITPRK